MTFGKYPRLGWPIYALIGIPFYVRMGGWAESALRVNRLSIPKSPGARLL